LPTNGRWPGRRRIAWDTASVAVASSPLSNANSRSGPGSDPSNIVDSCYPYGSIQVPGGTEPIILHRDAVSGGGYFMVGTVILADMDLIGPAPAPYADAVREGLYGTGTGGSSGAAAHD